MSNQWPDVVVDIDFGTTGTAVAYAKPIENKVYDLTTWPGRSEEYKQYDKVPSMVVFESGRLEAWGFGVMDLKIESIPNLDSYKLFKPLFDSQDPSEASEAERCVRIFLNGEWTNINNQQVLH
ncbi:hypothetical protein F5X97DRAFT_327011 [Nemania serpens]|nr:hypothetical protein F5X97DRAFT_327011 [Nemania serpens]